MQMYRLAVLNERGTVIEEITCTTSKNRDYDEERWKAKAAKLLYAVWVKEGRNMPRGPQPGYTRDTNEADHQHQVRQANDGVHRGAGSEAEQQ